jgi:hypothetical protein
MLGAIPLPKLFRKPLVDIRLGFALMRDRRVPLRNKLIALLLGLGITSIVEFLEIPVESILAVVLPVLGGAGDFILDGAELVVGPLLLANALLPFLTPRHVVDQLRAERAGAPGKGPIIDV